MKNILIKRKNMCENGIVYPIEVTHVACQTIDCRINKENSEFNSILSSIREKALNDFANKFSILYNEYYYSLPNSLLMYNIFTKRYEFTSKFHLPYFDTEDTITDLSLIAERCAEKINSKILGSSLTKKDISKIWGEIPYINYGYVYHDETKELTWFYNISR